MRSLALGLLCMLCCSAVRLDRRRLTPVAARSHNETKPAEDVCKATPLDFVFVIDSSRSIRPHDYEKVKAFIVKLLGFLQVGPAATRVGLLQYGSVVRPEFSLNTYTTEAQVERAVRRMEHLATGTMTGLALQYAMDTAFTEEEGARPAGLLIPRVAMVVTDGRPQDTVEEVAAQARRAGIQIYALGVGRVDMSTLKAIGSEPHSEHVHLVANFSQIETLISVFQDKLCGGSETCEVVEHQCQHICVSSPASYRCKCRKGFTLNPDGKTCTEEDRCADGAHGCEHAFRSAGGECLCSCRDGFTLRPDGKTCQKPACGDGVVDLVFVIDGSKSLGPANFQLVKQFVNVIVDSLDISRMGVHVGLLQYSSKVRTEFPLGRHSAARGVKQAVSRMQYMGRGSMTGAALRHMFQSSFSAKEGARPGVPRVGIVFTDGRAQDDVSGWADEAKNSGVTLYALGVGKAIEQELREIASEPDEKHLYYAEDFEKMGEITKKLKSSICEDKPPGESACRCESVLMFHTLVTEKLKTLVQSIEAITEKMDTLQNQVARK